jgi:hypothetical protein
MYVSTITSNTISTSRKFIGTKGRGNGLGVGPSTMHAQRRDDHGSQSLYRLAARAPRSHAPDMFVVTDADAAAIRAAFEQRGGLSAVVELRRLFPDITDNSEAQECARAIAGWRPLPVAPRSARRPGRGKAPWSPRLMP